MRWQVITRTLWTVSLGILAAVLESGGTIGAPPGSNEVRSACNGMLRDATNDYSTGIVTVASRFPYELSYEDVTCSNGAFTKSVVEALHGILTISELETYVSQRVEELTGRR